MGSARVCHRVVVLIMQLKGILGGRVGATVAVLVNFGITIGNILLSGVRLHFADANLVNPAIKQVKNFLPDFGVCGRGSCCLQAAGT